MRINQITTKSGQTIDLGHFTILIGPNNVGKSQTLRDIHNRVVSGARGRMVILTELQIPKPARFDELIRGVRVDDDPQNVNNSILRGVTSNLLGGEDVRVPLEDWRTTFAARPDVDWILNSIGKFQIAFLNAKTRLQVPQSTASYNPYEQGPQRLLQLLYSNAEAEERLREAFRATFQMDIKLDYSGLQKLYLRVAREFPDIPADPRQANPIMREFASLDEQGDGFRSFTAVLLSLLLNDGRILLIDEPEAFLHPAQARQLGVWVARLAAEGKSQVIVATHNANFLAGVLEGGEDVDVLRLNRRGEDTYYQRIAADHVEALTSSPLLSSQRVLEAVFHRGVVVCEADADRIYYHSLAAEALDEREILFVHAHNKQTVHEVVRLLRAADIPTAAIVDIDVLNASVDVKRLCDALSIADSEQVLRQRARIAERVEGADEDALIAELRAHVDALLQQLEADEHSLSGARSGLRRIAAATSKWRDVKRHGVAAFEGEAQDVARDLLNRLRGGGLFVVPVGELESWLDNGITRKSRWIVAALQDLRDNGPPEEAAEFITAVVEWLRNEGTNGA